MWCTETPQQLKTQQKCGVKRNPANLIWASITALKHGGSSTWNRLCSQIKSMPSLKRNSLTALVQHCVYTHNAGCLTCVALNLSPFSWVKQKWPLQETQTCLKSLSLNNLHVVLNNRSVMSTAEAERDSRRQLLPLAMSGRMTVDVQAWSIGKEQMDFVVNKNVSLSRPDGCHGSCLRYILLVLTEKYQKLFWIQTDWNILSLRFPWTETIPRVKCTVCGEWAGDKQAD